MKAFPKITKNETPIFYEGKFAGYENGQDGMDLRDYFAAKAMQGLLSNQPVFTKETTIDGETLTVAAYQLADAMMEAREQ